MITPLVVLFDLGNVLAHIDFNAFWCSLGLDESSERAPFFVGYEKLTRQYETGLISTEVFLHDLHALFMKRFTRVQLQRAFESVMTRPVEGMLELVREVSTTRQTALVSNTNELHYVLSYARFESLHVLHRNYLSYQLNVMKPDRGFYNAIIHDLQIHPSNMLFIDDLQANVEGARLTGMQAIRFEGVEKLKSELIQLGVL
jgi:HAD superfamily hydrolase (TIGR01509 family)